MADTTTIALDREAYELLRKQKRKDESFSDVVRRLARSRKPLSSFAGIWKGIPESEFRKIADAIRRGRELDLRRQEELLKRLE